MDKTMEETIKKVVNTVVTTPQVSTSGTILKLALAIGLGCGCAVGFACISDCENPPQVMAVAGTAFGCGIGSILFVQSAIFPLIKWDAEVNVASKATMILLQKEK